jgi:streptogramin lyase
MIEQPNYRVSGVPGRWGTKSHRKPAGRRRKQPTLDVLEGRCLLTSIVDFSTPTASSAPYEITLGPDGNIWFAEGNAGKIGEINSTTDAISEFTVDTSVASKSVYGITAGPDGNVWFTDSGTNSIGVINPTTDAMEEYPLPTAQSVPTGIVSGPGGNLWFTEQEGGKIGDINPATHAISEYTIPGSGSLPTDITLGSDGDLWFTEVGSDAIGSFNPATDAFSQFVIPAANTLPYDITTGPDGNLWLTMENFNQIEMFNLTTDAFSAITIPTAGADPIDIVTGPDGNLYFTEYNANQIGEINPTTHDFTQVGIPTANSEPWGITAGPNDNIWFTEFGASKVGVDIGTHLDVTGEPLSTLTAGAVFGITISDVDSSGVVDQNFSGEATITLASVPAAPALNGTLTAPFVNGVATFFGLTLESAGNGYTIQATSPNALAQVTSSFNVTPAAAAHLVIASPPPSTVSPGGDFGLTVEVSDKYGNPVTTYSGSVTATLANNPGGSSLSGTTVLSVSPASSTPGYVTFAGLSLNNPGNGYTLIVSASGLASATTTAISVPGSVQPPPPPHPPSPSPPPAIASESVVTVQKRNKKGKKVGKPVISGYLITFGTAMNQGTLANAANYRVETVAITKRTKKKPAQTVFAPIAFDVTSVSSNSVTLSPTGKPFTKKAGIITLEPSSPGIESTGGAFLASDVAFNISRGGKSISVS